MTIRSISRAAVAAVAAAAFWGAVSAQAAVHEFRVQMDNAQELLAVGNGRGAPINGPSPDAWGLGYFLYDDVTNIFTQMVMGGGGLKEGITNQHIHLGGLGVAGAIIVPLPANIYNIGGLFSYVGTNVGTLAQEHEAALFAGGTYVNIHTSWDPAGEIRGQLIPVVAIPEPETYAMMLAGLGLVGWAAMRRRKVGV